MNTRPGGFNIENMKGTMKEPMVRRAVLVRIMEALHERAIMPLPWFNDPDKHPLGFALNEAKRELERTEQQPIETPSHRTD